MTETEIKLWTAVITAVASLIVAITSAVLNRRSQKDIETLKNTLAEQKSENDARRDYEYEARKRLYQECEPLFFQLAEVSEYALFRGQSLARTARLGDLSGQNHWLSSGHDYYMSSTLYNLLAPVAVFKLIQRRITFVDLTVEPSINDLYQLAKAIYVSFTDDFDFAQIKPQIGYNPIIKDWQALRKINPASYWRQGIPVGRLDIAAESLLLKENSQPVRLLSFGEFDLEYRKTNSPMQTNFATLTDIFTGFHPSTRPVLWRILIAQAHLYRALMEPKRTGTIRSIPLDQRKLLDWRQTPDEASDNGVLEEPFRVAEQYLVARLGKDLKS